MFGLFILGFLMFCVGAMKHSPYDKVPKVFNDAATRVDSKVTASTFDPATDVPPVQPLPECCTSVPRARNVGHGAGGSGIVPLIRREEAATRAEVPGRCRRMCAVATGYGASRSSAQRRWKRGEGEAAPVRRTSREPPRHRLPRAVVEAAVYEGGRMALIRNGGAGKAGRQTAEAPCAQRRQSQRR